MTSKIMDTLEILEEKIENIKWMIAAPFSFKRTGVSGTISIIRRSAGILGKGFSRGTIFENRSRRNWKINFLRRMR